MSAGKGETKKKKGLTWAEAAKQVLARSADPLTHKDILKVIQEEGLRDLSRGTAPLACLNAMLHHHSRGPNDLFIKVEGRMSCYKLNPNRVETSGDNSGNSQDSDSDSMDMPDDSDFNHFLDKDSLNGLSNGKVKIPMGTNSVLMPQLKPPPPNPSPRDPKSKPSLTKDGRLQKKRGPKGPRSSTATKRPRLTSTRPVPKMVLKNLKVGTDEINAGSSAKNGNGKVKPSSVLIPPSSQLINPSRASVTANSIASHSFQNLPGTADDMDGRETLEKFSDLWTNSKPRRYKKMSVAAQLKKTKEGRIDISTPDSILTSIPLRSLINQRTFNMLPALYQYQLVKLLPRVDKSVGSDGGLRPSHSAFTNEFFASACHSWRDRLQDGDFMTDMQLKRRQEEERLAKLDPWKAKFFEPVWGKRKLSDTEESAQDLAHAYFTEPLSPAPAVPSHKDHNVGRSQLNPPKSARISSAMIQPLTVPVKKLPPHCLPKQRVSESRRSEAAKQLRANAKAGPSRPRSIPIYRMVTVAVANEALKAVRTCAPDNMLTTSTVYSRKRTIKTPCSETASDGSSMESSATSLSNASVFTHEAVDLPKPATLIKQRPPSRAAMRSQAASKENSTRRGSATAGVSKGFSVNSVTSKAFSRSMLLKNCSCRLKAMEICRKCGAFCHDDCITAAQLCNACVN